MTAASPPSATAAAERTAATADSGSRAWLGWLCANRLAASMSFMVYAGTLDTVREAWGMSAGEAGSIQTGFNISYAASLVVASWLADRIGAKRVFVWSSCLAAAATIAFAALARSYLSGLVLFAAAGLALGGTYTPSIMLVAQGVPAARRGGAVGLLLAAGSFGYLLSIAMARTLAGTAGYAAAFAVCGAAPAAGAVAALIGLRSRANLVVPSPQPQQPHRAPEAGADGNLLRDRRRALLLTLGYTAHCWELLGMWGWMPAFLAAAAAAAGAASSHAAAPPPAAMLGLAIGAIIHLSGCAASFLAGHAADRFGYRRVLIAMGLAGAACSFAIGWAGQAPAAVLWPLAALYGFAALGDSPVLSAAMTESVEPGRLGRALAVRSILGFGAGGLAPVAFGFVLDSLGNNGSAAWGAAFGVLGIGGALATLCAALLPPDGRRHR